MMSEKERAQLLREQKSTGATMLLSKAGFASGSNEPMIERTYETAPQVITHQEKTIVEKDNAPTRVETHQEDVQVVTHVNQPIIKEHVREVVHEHH